MDNSVEDHQDLVDQEFEQMRLQESLGVIMIRLREQTGEFDDAA